MTYNVEIAHADVPRPDKGEDCHLVRALDANRTKYLLAVADGLSLNGGAAAARWVIRHLGETQAVGSARALLDELRKALAQFPEGAPESETTLTCGLVDIRLDGEQPRLHFEFFAIGDSPIWKVVVGRTRYPYQRMLVHGTPYPAETSRVYSTVRLHSRDIKGPISFGAIEVECGEVLVVCTDGVPEREVFIRDLTSTDAPSSQVGLCAWLFSDERYASGALREILENYDSKGVLFDDATLIVARIAPSQTREVPESIADEQASSTMEESGELATAAEDTPDQTEFE